jgi:ribose transport system permease protein
MRLSDRLTIFLFRYSRILLLFLIVLALSLVNSRFLTVANLANVITQQAPFLMLISFGMTLAIITKGIDLSLGATVALSSCLAAYFIKNGQIMAGVLVSLGVGAAAGAVNGILITKVGLSPFFATYGMDWLIRGFAYMFMGGTMIYGLDEKFRLIGTGSVCGVSNLIIITAVIFVILFVLLCRTNYGRNIYAIGCNERATRLSGVNTSQKLISVYMIGGFLAAVAGLLYIARLNAAEAVIGENFSMQSMAATLVGGTSFIGGQGGIGRTVIGALIIVFITNGLNLLNISSLWQQVLTGLVILLSLFIEKFGNRIIEAKTAKLEA